MLDIKALLIFFVTVFAINYLIHSDLQRALTLAAISTVLYLLITTVIKKIRK